MSYLSEELERQIKSRGLSAAAVARATSISASQLSNWMRAAQTTICYDHLTALAHALSTDPEDHARLVRAHLMDERFGPGSELVDVVLLGPAALRDMPRGPTERERALDLLRAESLSNRELSQLLIHLARLFGPI